MAKEPWGVSDQHPANGYRGLAGAVPDRRLGGELHSSGGAVIPGHRGAGPGCLGLVKESLERGPPRAFERRATVLSRLTGWRWSIEGGVHAQTGDQGDGFPEGLAAVEQVQHGVAVVAHQHQRALRQPATQLQYHLPGPIGEFLVPASLLLVVPCRWRQHREHRQGPVPTGPGDMAQPHQGDPAQATGLDQLVATGAHRVAVDAPGVDPGTATSFEGLINAEDQRVVAVVEVLEQQH